jgi:hypothetical protein
LRSGLRRSIHKYTTKYINMHMSTKICKFIWINTKIHFYLYLHIYIFTHIHKHKKYSTHTCWVMSTRMQEEARVVVSS